MSNDLFEEIARRARQPGSPAVQPDAQPADAASLFEDIARQAMPRPMATPEAPRPAERGMVERAIRAPAMVGQGFNERLAQVVGGLPDTASWALRQVGIETSAPGQYTDWARRGIQAITGAPQPPETDTERALQGAGRGVADAATVFMPATALAQSGRLGAMGQGVAQTLAGQPAMQMAAGAAGGAVGEATDSPLAGMAAAMAVPAGVALAGRTVSPVRSVRNAEERRLIEVARAEGIPVSAAAATGSRPLQSAEGVWRTSPLTARPMAEADDAVRRAFNRAVLRNTGTSADSATPEVLRETRNRLGARFTDLSARNALRADPQLEREMAGLLRELPRRYPQQSEVARRYLADYVNAFEGNQLPGTAYRNIDSAVGARMRSTQDGDLRAVLGRMRDSFRGAMDRSISPEDAQSWRDVRREYANLMTVARAMNSPSAATAAGNIPPAGLSQAVAQGPQRNFAWGRGEMNDLARVGRLLVQDQVPNSGTSERTLMAALLSGQYPRGTMAAMAVNRALNAGYMHPGVQSWLTNQRGAALPDMQRAILASLLLGQREGLPIAAQGAVQAGGNFAGQFLP